jgi:hypothetical protein
MIWADAAAVVGAVVLYQEFPRWLRPPVKPFTCGLCLSFWLGCGVSAATLEWQTPLIAVLGVAILDGAYPWLLAAPRGP